MNTNIECNKIIIRGDKIEEISTTTSLLDIET